jgi:2-polyprenyl-3-methyl-5-hydroxy-6-metoxy-1,4-benzoquinol methylase
MGETLEHIACNLCGRAETRPFLRMDGFGYRRCAHCGLVYQNPRPVFKDLRKRYGAGYFEYEHSNQENFFNLMKMGLRDIEFERFYPSCDGRRFLDIGCATGLLLDHVRRMGWTVRGVEVCRESAEYGIRKFGLEIFVGTLEEAAFQDASFDVVHLSHVIEHVPDPRALLREISRVLREDGHLVLTTPNVDGFQAKASKTRWRSAIPDHVVLFSKKTMAKLLERERYRIVRQISWGGIPLGKRPNIIKRPADKLAKLFNVGDVMLFYCKPEKFRTHA